MSDVEQLARAAIDRARAYHAEVERLAREPEVRVVVDVHDVPSVVADYGHEHWIVSFGDENGRFRTVRHPAAGLVRGCDTLSQALGWALIEALRRGFVVVDVRITYGEDRTPCSVFGASGASLALANGLTLQTPSDILALLLPAPTHP